jgi:arsenic resistance protein ArsH
MNYLSNEKFNIIPNKLEISQHRPRILIIYGSLRDRSFSRLLAEEAGRILEFMGAEVKFFNPTGLPLFDNGKSENHSKVVELRELSLWSEGQVWSSPELHGNISGIMKMQIDWIPLTMGSVRPTQGRTLAVMQVSGGSQSFNAVNSLRILGRWMRMITIPNQSSVAKAYNEFNDDGTMKDSAYRKRVVDVMEELMRFTYLTRDHSEFLVDRYSERLEVQNKAFNDINLKKNRHRNIMKTLKEQTDAKIESGRQKKPEFMNNVDDIMLEQKKLKYEEKALQIGQASPLFKLPNQIGEVVTLSELIDKGPVVVTFYRGSWCPYCNLQLRALELVLPEIKALGAQLVAISPQAPDNSLSDEDISKMSFTVLSDQDSIIANKFGIAWNIPDILKEHMKVDRELDLGVINNDEGNALPIPATFIISRKGEIMWRFIDVDYRNRSEPSDIIKALKELSKIKN